MAFADTITPVTGKTFDKLDIGKYMLQGTTLDQPSYLLHTSRGFVANATKPATFTAKLDHYINSAVPGDSDTRIQAWFSLSLVPGSITQANLEPLLLYLPWYMSGAPLTKALRGER